MSISFPQWYSVSNNYPLVFSFNPPFSYSFPLFIPSILFTKPSAASASVTKKVKKAAPKASTATITTNGEVIVQQILQGSYVHDSDHAVHAALLPFNPTLFLVLTRCVVEFFCRWNLKKIIFYREISVSLRPILVK